MRSLRPHLTYANVMATIAVFIALCGTSYAAIKVTGKNVKDGSLTGVDVKDKSLHAADLADDAKFAGPVGAQGAMGPRGADGANGVNGADGVNGTNGTNGSDGAKGATGPTGEKGATGATGSDAQFNGAAAGGDLAGTFPNPTLKAVPAARFAGVVGDGCDSVSDGVSNLKFSFTGAVYWNGGISTSSGADPCGDGTVVTAFQVQKAGLYLVGAALGFTNVSGAGRRELAISVNGNYVVDSNLPAVTSATQFLSTTTAMYILPGQDVTVTVAQDSGSPVEIFTGPRSNFWIQYVGPLS